MVKITKNTTVKISLVGAVLLTIMYSMAGNALATNIEPSLEDVPSTTAEIVTSTTPAAERQALAEKTADLIWSIRSLPHFVEWRELNYHFSQLTYDCILPNSGPCGIVRQALDPTDVDYKLVYIVVEEAEASPLYTTDATFRENTDILKADLQERVAAVADAASALGIELNKEDSPRTIIEQLWGIYEFRYWRTLVGNGNNVLSGTALNDSYEAIVGFLTLDWHSDDQIEEIYQYFQVVLALQEPGNPISGIWELAREITSSTRYDVWFDMAKIVDALAVWIEDARNDGLDDRQSALDELAMQLRDKLKIVDPSLQTDNLSPEELYATVSSRYATNLRLARITYRYDSSRTPLDMIGYEQTGFGSFPFLSTRYVYYYNLRPNISLESLTRDYNAYLADWEEAKSSFIVADDNTPEAPDTGILGILVDGIKDLSCISVVVLAGISMVAGSIFIARLWLKRRIK